MPDLQDIHDLTLSSALHLGVIDEGVPEPLLDTYFQLAHKEFMQWHDNEAEKEKYRTQFRGDGFDEWITPERRAGETVGLIQAFLHEHGFLPGAHVNGIFDYRTQASVRLFQEYIRTIEGKAEIGTPDGIVGNGTLGHMKRWVVEKKYSVWGPDESRHDPSDYGWTESTEEYDKWMALLPEVRDEYLSLLAGAPAPSTNIEVFQLQELNNYPHASDSLAVKDWTFNRGDIHLVGVRCRQDERSSERGNDDLFILLMNGMVFKFWGSTDPRPSHTSDGHEPYITEGQHKYKLSWHKRSDARKIYKALVPFSKGVLVFRDWSDSDALTEKDILKGLQANPTGKPSRNNPNSTINIHWTFDGKRTGLRAAR